MKSNIIKNIVGLAISFTGLAFGVVLFLRNTQIPEVLQFSIYGDGNFILLLCLSISFVAIGSVLVGWGSSQKAEKNGDNK